MGWFVSTLRLHDANVANRGLSIGIPLLKMYSNNPGGLLLGGG